ncbi:MAG: NAD(P)-dependent alcohol dehydrogenase [Planctomycetota bacterium]
MQALVLEPDRQLNIRDIDLSAEDTLDPHDVRIKLHTVGVCGSDVHYYQHGQIGPFIVEAPMVLGHEAAGTVVEAGGAVKNFREGDRVCMEPGVPDPNGQATRLGMYNLDPAVRFWATPPIHGVLRPTVVHPAAFTFKLPDNVGFGEGAMVEPLAVGMHAAAKAKVKPGDVAVVTGAGPIGMVTALAALAAGCASVIVTDIVQPKLDLAESLKPGAICGVNVGEVSAREAIDELTNGWGADVVFECSGNERAAAGVFDLIAPGGCVVYVGMPGGPIHYDVVAAQIKEARVEHVFRYAHVYPRALRLMGSGQLDVKPLITNTFAFAHSKEAFDFCVAMPDTSVKAQIEMPQD